jgi:hypothetical protein
VLEPLDVIARLAALVPRPRLHLTRFHGLIAANFKHRNRIVPRPPGHLGADHGAPQVLFSAKRKVAPASLPALVGLRPNRTLVLACTRHGSRNRAIQARGPPADAQQALQLT